ncbi:hypothetical protein GYB29_00480 [bacterium]|jgi:hypothetical protein|nr:hypothetical protein [Balneola sp.]MBR9916181.1 hypothetical protein [bacterium]
MENDTSDINQTSKKEGCGSGCLGAFVILIGAVIFGYCSLDESDYYLMPGEANMSTDAIEQTFREIDRILPDSLVVDDPLNPYNHYSEAESFGNLFYGLNPVIMTALKSDTSKKYRFQYIARVDHVDANEFVIRDFLVDSIWRYEPIDLNSEDSFWDN